MAKDRSTPFAGCTMAASNVTPSQRAARDDAQRTELSAMVDQSSLAPDNFTTLPHFSVSSTMSLPKSLGEPRQRDAAEIDNPRLHLGVGDAGIDLLVELVDDLDRRVPGCADAKPAASLVARYEFGDGRDVPQRIQAPLGGHRQRAQFAGSHVLERRCRGAEVKLHLSAQQ